MQPRALHRPAPPALALLVLALLALAPTAAAAASRAGRPAAADRANRGDRADRDDPAPHEAPESPDDPDDLRDDDRAGREAATRPPPPATAPRPPPGPAVAEVLRAAYRAAGLDRDPTRGLARRARLAGLVPSLTVRTGRNTSWQDTAPDVDRGTSVEARATWRLDRLVFDSHELQAASMRAARGRERRQLASRVIRAYFQWRRAVAAAAPPPGAATAEEAAAELDALTDGWFSAELARPARRPPAKAR